MLLEILFVFSSKTIVVGNPIEGRFTRPVSYKLSSEEVQALSKRRHEGQEIAMPRHVVQTRQAGSESITSSFDDMKNEPDHKAFCESKFRFNSPQRGWKTKFTFKKARCDRYGPSTRQYTVTCDSSFRTYGSKWDHLGEPEDFVNQCPKKFSCLDVDHYDLAGHRVETVICVEEVDVAIEWILEAEAIPGSPTTGLMHCSPEQWVPTTSHPGAPSKGVEVVLTEEAIYPNGSAYKSPNMLIHDKTSPYPVDRVWRQNVHVASAKINIIADHGRLQRRRIQYCMEIVSQRRDFFVIFLHAWTMTKMNQRGRIPEE